jgi:hypothetical protein
MTFKRKMAVALKNRLPIALVAAFLIGWGPASEVYASSITLPDATISLDAVAYPNTCSVNCTGETYNGPFLTPPVQLLAESYPADPDGTYPAGSATAIAYSGIPEVTAESTGNAGADSSMTYYFEIFGAANTTVPISIAGVVTVDGGSESNDGGVSVIGLFGFGLLSVCPNSASGNSAEACTAPFLTDAAATSDTLYQVQIFAESFEEIGVGNSNFSPAQYVDIDPVISISSTFADANQFQLDFSPAIGDSVSTPEPASFILLLTAVTGAALVARKRIAERAEPIASVSKRPV